TSSLLCVGIRLVSSFASATQGRATSMHHSLVETTPRLSPRMKMAFCLTIDTCPRQGAAYGWRPTGTRCPKPPKQELVLELRGARRGLVVERTSRGIVLGRVPVDLRRPMILRPYAHVLDEGPADTAAARARIDKEVFEITVVRHGPRGRVREPVDE